MTDRRDDGGPAWVVFNPHDKPVDDLPVIYGFNNGGSPGWFHGALLAADGTPLGGHVCSSEGFMPGDLGVVAGWRDDRHEAFREHYPDGYRMEFVSHDAVQAHDGLMAAIRLANATATEAASRTNGGSQ